MSIDLDKEKTYGLTDEENLMLACFLGPISYAFRDDYYTDALPEIVSEMQIILNQAIAKAPKFSGKVLYRFTHEYDQTEFRKGDIYQPSHNLTTTTEDWEQKCNVYVITPLPENETNAYCLFQIYNQGDEFQVSFLRGASFIITKIAKTDNSEYRRIYMTELKSSQQTRTIQLT